MNNWALTLSIFIEHNFLFAKKLILKLLDFTFKQTI